MKSWQADAVGYGRRPYMLRSHFRQVETVSRQEMISRTLEAAKTNLKMNLSGPKFYNSIEALQHFAEDLHGGCGEKMRDMLVYFSLPLGAWMQQLSSWRRVFPKLPHCWNAKPCYTAEHSNMQLTDVLMKSRRWYRRWQKMKKC